MQTSRTHTFLSDWGLHLVLLAIAVPIVGLAYLAWTVLPTMRGATPVPSATTALAIQAAVRDSVGQCRALDAIVAFRESGLAAQVVPGESKDERDGLSGFRVINFVRFRISENDQALGMVLCFKNAGDLQRMRNYYAGLNRALPQYRSWVFVKDNMLLQVNHEVPEREAHAYAAALDTLDQ